MALTLVISLLAGAANIAVGSNAASNGVIYGVFGAALVVLLYIVGAGVFASSLSAVATAAFFMAWRSQSPRGADLDLLFEPTWKEAGKTVLRHGLPLLAIAFVTFHWWLPVLVAFPIAGHLLASNKTAFGRWLMSFGQEPGASIFVNHGYHRRFGELVSGLFCFGPALALLAARTVEVAALY